MNVCEWIYMCYACQGGSVGRGGWIGEMGCRQPPHTFEQEDALYSCVNSCAYIYTRVNTRSICARVNTRSVLNTTAGKVATMNVCANSRHLPNSWKSCMWALFCHLGGLSGRFLARKYPKMLRNFKILSWMCWQLAASGPPKYWRLIWKLWIWDLQL